MYFKYAAYVQFFGLGAVYIGRFHFIFVTQMTLTVVQSKHFA